MSSGRPRTGEGAQLAPGLADGGLPGPGVLLLMAALGLGCAETVRPVLGSLRIGSAPTSFQLPSMLNERPPFEYPRDAWREGVGGETLLRIHIAADGAVDSVRVERSSGHRSLDSAAVAGARKLRYRPARHGGEPVDVWAVLPIRYPLPAAAQRDP